LDLLTPTDGPLTIEQCVPKAGRLPEVTASNDFPCLVFVSNKKVKKKEKQKELLHKFILQ
jgi:hypothetical protein